MLDWTGLDWIEWSGYWSFCSSAKKEEEKIDTLSFLELGFGSKELLRVDRNLVFCHGFKCFSVERGDAWSIASP